MASQEVAITALDCEYFTSNYDAPSMALHIEKPLREEKQSFRFGSRDEAEIVAAQLTIAGYDNVKITSRRFPNQEFHRVTYR